MSIYLLDSRPQHYFQDAHNYKEFFNSQLNLSKLQNQNYIQIFQELKCLIQHYLVLKLKNQIQLLQLTIKSDDLKLENIFDLMQIVNFCINLINQFQFSTILGLGFSQNNFKTSNILMFNLKIQN